MDADIPSLCLSPAMGREDLKSNTAASGLLRTVTHHPYSSVFMLNAFQGTADALCSPAEKLPLL